MLKDTQLIKATDKNLNPSSLALESVLLTTTKNYLAKFFVLKGLFEMGVKSVTGISQWVEKKRI